MKTAELSTLKEKPVTEPHITSQANNSEVVTDGEAEAKAFIYFKESGNSPCKINGGAIDCAYDGNRACGIGQALPCQKLTAVCNLSDYGCQDAWFTNYAVQRYGSWIGAKQFWINHKWW